MPDNPHARASRAAEIDFSQMQPPDDETREWMDAPGGPQAASDREAIARRAAERFADPGSVLAKAIESELRSAYHWGFADGQVGEYDIRRGWQ